jgi:hypothetical protein
MNGLNILITQIHAVTKTATKRESAAIVCIRDGYTRLRDDDAGRPTAVTVWAYDEFSATSRNGAGNLGAFVPYIGRPDLDAAVKLLRDAWGDVPISSNLSPAKIIEPRA